MKRTRVAWLTLLCGILWMNGCSKPEQVEERFIILPPNNPKTSLATASQIEKKLITKGMGAEVQRHFPKLSHDQLSGLFLAANEGVVQGSKKIYLRTGLRYSGTLPEAKAVADYAEVLVRRFTITTLITPTHVGKTSLNNGASALELDYQTTIPAERPAELRAEVDWIWEGFALDVDHAHFTNAVIRVSHAASPGGLLIASQGAVFSFEKRNDGKWHSLQDTKK